MTQTHRPPRAAPTAVPGPVCVVAENVFEPASEAYEVVVRELCRALARRAPVRLRVIRYERRAPLSRLARVAALLWLALDRRQWRERPALVVYVSRSSATLFGLLRARILKVASGGRPVAMLALQEWILNPRSIAARLLLPDLLLVETRAQLEAAELMGARVRLVSSGVDLERFRPASPGEKIELRRRFGLDAGRPVILHVGHLTRGRNLEALLGLARCGHQVLVVISNGAQPGTEPLLAELGAAGCRVIRGFQPAIEDYYRVADCYVFPTRSPGHAVNLPLSVLEAMACDLPVACSSFGALPERFEGCPGVCFARRDEDLRAAVTAALAAGGGTRGAVERYSWDALAEGVMDT